jgi:N-acylneuraminate cytidylyltransferase
MSEFNKKKINNLLVIPARKGSRRIKNKNIKIFYGRPIISYTIQKGKESGLFSKIIVSTDCKKIAKIAQKFGASIDFIRPAYLSTDTASTINVMQHALKFLKKRNEVYKYVCCMYPVAPLVNIKIFKNCYNILKRSKLNYVFPVSKFQGSNKTFIKISKNRTVKLKLNNINNKEKKIFYNDTGQYYWGKSNSWLKKKNIFTSRTKVLIVPKNSFVDVNTISDWKMLLRLFKKK